MLPGCRYKKFTQIQPPLENFMTYVEPGGGPPDDDDSRQKIRPAGPLMTMTRRFGRNGTVDEGGITREGNQDEKDRLNMTHQESGDRYGEE